MLARSWADNEYATALRLALEDADRTAKRLLLEAQSADQAGTGDRAPPVVGKTREEARSTAVALPEQGEREVDATTVGELTVGLSSLVGEGKRVWVGWQVIP